MKKHKISWLNVPGYIPETWNPIIGCDKISEGCEHCYAEKMAFRLANMGQRNYCKVVQSECDMSKTSLFLPKWAGTTNFIEEAIDKPKTWKQPRAIFVCSMGDLFHQTAKEEWINRVFDTIEACPQHIFIILTKRADLLKKYSIHQYLMGFPPNVWIGVTTETQQRANERIPILLSIYAAKRFVSIEPMLDAINLEVIHWEESHINALYGSHNSYPDGYWKQKPIPKLDWVIVGGETGPGAREIDIAWVNSIEMQCSQAGVPFFMKSFGSKQKDLDVVITDDYRQFPQPI